DRHDSSRSDGCGRGGSCLRHFRFGTCPVVSWGKARPLRKAKIRSFSEPKRAQGLPPVLSSFATNALALRAALSCILRTTKPCLPQYAAKAPPSLASRVVTDRHSQGEMD